MSFDLAVRTTEVLLALAFLQQSMEYISVLREGRLLFVLRIVLSLLLLIGIYAQWASLMLLIVALFILWQFQGPYNGGSDRMGLLILCCLTLALFFPERKLPELAFGYLALQLVLSYFIAGWVKIVNPEWRSGQALQDVFHFSAYPVSESLRGWADRPQLLHIMSWAVMLFELCFPFTMLTHTTLVVGLVIAATFHFANACLFGLNRFFWIWLAAYPSLLWFQERILN